MAHLTQDGSDSFKSAQELPLSVPVDHLYGCFPKLWVPIITPQGPVHARANVRARRMYWPCQ